MEKGHTDERVKERKKGVHERSERKFGSGKKIKGANTSFSYLGRKKIYNRDP
jgi:hypothetical protein